MRFLLASASLGAIASALFPASAFAQTEIKTATTNPVSTSTTGDLQITSAGSIKLASGVAVTINSNAKVTNAGTLSITGGNGSAGIVANANLSGDITNSGAITLDENYTPTDSDKDGDVDGPFAQGSNRYGIHVLGGGTYTGKIANSGTITVEGNSSAGIAIDSALSGSITKTGKITVTGDDSVGLRAAAVSGDVKLTAGSISAIGKNAVGVLLGGDVGGAFVVQGSVTSTGYRYTSVPADTSKLDSDDLLQGGSAVVVAGDVAGGVLLDAPASGTSGSTAKVVTYGAAPAMLIGSASEDVLIGKSGSTEFSLINKGTIAGYGLYKGVSATGLMIGGGGHVVTFAGGLSVTGAIIANAVEANSAALHIGSGASLPVIANGGNIAAVGGGTESTSATAILIDAGANVPTIKNSGSIAAGVSGTAGAAAAIVDKSGTLTLIENSGTIGVADSVTLGERATAIDLRANTVGATIKQVAAATGKPAPQIAGNILFGSGNDSLSVLAGSISGNVDFGGGSDVFSLGSQFHGQLLNSAGLALNVGSGGFLDITNAGTVNLASLTTGANAMLGVRIGGSSNTLYDVAGQATFGAGTKLVVFFDKISDAPGTYTIVEAGSLAGAENLTSSIVTLPFLFSSEVSASGGDVSLEVKLKDSDELGLNGSETSILDAAIDAVDVDRPVAAVLLGAADSTALRSTLQQLMPDHAGGAFESVSKSTRLAADMFGDATPGLNGGSGLWLHQFAWSTSKPIGSTSDFDVSGWGATAGYERSLGPIGSLGVTLVYASGRDGKGDNDLVGDHYDAGIYWRAAAGPFRAFARGSAGIVSFGGTRNFSGTVNGTTVTRSAHGNWDGHVVSAIGGVSYELQSGRFSVRPSATIDYIRLTEKGYSETGDSDAFNLTVADRTSSETGANLMLALGYDLVGSPSGDSGWLRLELEGGRRELLSGSLGDTVANFKDGEAFTLAAEERTSGWRGGLRLSGGGSAMGVSADLGAEQLQGETALSGRIGINLAL
jgi:hypothetical protein